MTLICFLIKGKTLVLCIREFDTGQGRGQDQTGHSGGSALCMFPLVSEGQDRAEVIGGRKYTQGDKARKINFPHTQILNAKET